MNFSRVLCLIENKFHSALSLLYNLTSEIYDDFYFIIAKEKLIQICVLLFVLEGIPNEKNLIVKYY